jgi:hypothetical protein
MLLAGRQRRLTLYDTIVVKHCKGMTDHDVPLSINSIHYTRHVQHLLFLHATAMSHTVTVMYSVMQRPELIC